MTAKGTKQKKTARKRSQREPSKRSLKESPSFESKDTIDFGRGPAAVKRALAWSRGKRGRPKKGDVPAGTVTKTVRFSVEEGKMLDRVAKQRGISVNAVMREAIVKIVAKAG